MEGAGEGSGKDTDVQRCCDKSMELAKELVVLAQNAGVDKAADPLAAAREHANTVLAEKVQNEGKYSQMLQQLEVERDKVGKLNTKIEVLKFQTDKQGKEHARDIHRLTSQLEQSAAAESRAVSAAAISGAKAKDALASAGGGGAGGAGGGGGGGAAAATAAANTQALFELRERENQDLRTQNETLKLSELRARRESALAVTQHTGANGGANTHAHHQLAAEKRAAEDERDRLRRDNAETQRNLELTRNEIRQLHTLDAERKVALDKVLENYKSEFSKLKGDRDKARLDLETAKSAGTPGHRQLVRESDKMIASLREENSSLKEQVGALRKQLQTKTNPSANPGSESLQQLKGRIFDGSLSPAEKDQNLKRLITELADQWETIEGSKETEEILIQEIDSTGQSLEKTQEHNVSLLRTLNEKEEELYEVVSSKMRADQAHKLSREKTTLQTQQVKMLKDEVAKKTSVIEKLQENEKLHRESIWTNEKRIRDKDLQIENERRSREEKDKAAKDMEARCEKAKGELIKYMDEVEGKVKASTKLESEVTKLREQTSLLKKE